MHVICVNWMLQRESVSLFANLQNNPDGPTSCKRTVLSNNSFLFLAFGLQLDWILLMVTDFATDKNVGRYAGEDDEEDFPL